MERPSRLRGWLPALAIALAAAIAYLPALRGGFVFDDQPLLVAGNALNQGPLSRIWLSAEAPDYLPLTWTTFWAEWRLFGAMPFAFHATNVLLHAAAAILLWRVLARLRVPGAWLAGLLFAVHPVAVESVAWISERKNTLSAVFFLAAALAWLAAEGTPGADAAARWRRLLAFGLFTLALLSKATVVMLPVALVAISEIRDRRLERRHLLRAAPLFGVALAAGIVAIWFQRENALGGSSLGRGIGERIGGAAWALAFYVEKSFVPVHLGFVYPEWPVRPGSPLFYAPLVAAALAAGILWRYRRGPARPVSLALGYQALMVLPALGLLDMAYLKVGPVANHLQYLALMGPTALVAYGLARLEQVAPRRAVRAGAAALALALGASTFERARAFESDATLWERAVLDAPASTFARKQYALTLLELGRTGDAVGAFRAYAGLVREPAEGHRALAVAAMLEGRWKDAVAEGRAAHRLQPDPQFQRDLARALERAGRGSDAAELLEEGGR